MQYAVSHHFVIVSGTAKAQVVVTLERDAEK